MPPAPGLALSHLCTMSKRGQFVTEQDKILSSCCCTLRLGVTPGILFTGDLWALQCRLSKKVISLGSLWFPFIQCRNGGFRTHEDLFQDPGTGSFVMGVGCFCCVLGGGGPGRGPQECLISKGEAEFCRKAWAMGLFPRSL